MGLFSRAPKAANASARTATTAPPAPPARQLTLMGVVVRDGTDFDEVFQAGIAALEDASKQFGGINSSIQAAPTGASNRFIIVLENASVLRLFWNRGIGMPPTVMWTFEDGVRRIAGSAARESLLALIEARDFATGTQLSEPWKEVRDRLTALTGLEPIN